MNPASVPEEFLCPITLEIMKDPVIGPDGHTYERVAIAAWLLQGKTTSPVTRERMNTKDLRPNFALKALIARWQSSTPAAPPLPPSPPLNTPPAATKSRGHLSFFRPHLQPLFKSPELKTTAVLSEDTLWVQVAPPERGKRQQVDMIMIIDNSGSMGCAASEGSGEAPEGSFGFSRLDLVKHAVRTVAAVLNADDTLALVSFSTVARVALACTHMDDAGRRAVDLALKRIEPESATNMYDGVRKAAEVAQSSTGSGGRGCVAVLLTDGYPNVDPPMGLLPTLRKMKLYRPWVLHTFGFGYDLDSCLLAGMADWGHGIFGFIPDCSMVGTVFINLLATTLATAVQDVTVSVATGGVLDKPRTLYTGPLAYGQPRDLVVPLHSSSAKLQGAIKVTVNGAAIPLKVAAEGTAGTPAFESARASFMDVIAAVLVQCKAGCSDAAAAALTAWAESLKSSHEGAEEESRVSSLLRDVLAVEDGEGQVGMAPRFWERWGEHYLRAYLRSQQLQHRMNFKDPGLAIYGGAQFEEVQAAAEESFCGLDPPQPSVQLAAGQTQPVITSMAAFHNAAGGCFHGPCRLLMADGTRKAVRDISPGDAVWTPAGDAVVRALVACGSGAAWQPITQLTTAVGELYITPWHPVLVDGAWQFPANLAGCTEISISTVYNLVLTLGHVVDVEGIRCVTLAHGFKGAVVEHAFFGTEAVLLDLAKQPGWRVGRPVYRDLRCTRDTETGAVIGWCDNAANWGL